MKVVSLVGARPQFIKEAMVGSVARKRNAWRHVLVHSGQHYDVNMSDLFFQQLDIQALDHFLGIGSGSHGKQTALALEKMENILLDEKPDMLLVYGDTNTTLAGALAAAKLKVPVAHIEAGIRQEPKDMPEEINRVMTDHISAQLFACSELSVQNLAREGMATGVFNAGDVMYDLYLKMQSHFDAGALMTAQSLETGGFVLVTLHRDFNVDDPAKLRNILAGVSAFARQTGLRVLFPIHPRTRKRIQEFNLESLTGDMTLSEPVGYFELMGLVRESAFVITDSGGLQKEAYYGGKRAVVVMPDTGWRELVEVGWNLLADPTEESVAAQCSRAAESVSCPEAVYGDGHAAEKIVERIISYLG